MDALDQGGVVRAIKVYALGMSGMSLHVSPTVDLQQVQLALEVWFQIFLVSPSCISMKQTSGSVVEDYGVPEISGWGVPIEDEPEQVVTAICVVA